MVRLRWLLEMWSEMLTQQPDLWICSSRKVKLEVRTWERCWLGLPGSRFGEVFGVYALWSTPVKRGRLGQDERFNYDTSSAQEFLNWKEPPEHFWAEGKDRLPKPMTWLSHWQPHAPQKGHDFGQGASQQARQSPKVGDNLRLLWRRPCQ